MVAGHAMHRGARDRASHLELTLRRDQSVVAPPALGFGSESRRRSAATRRRPGNRWLRDCSRVDNVPNVDSSPHVPEVPLGREEYFRDSAGRHTLGRALPRHPRIDGTTRCPLHFGQNHMVSASSGFGSSPPPWITRIRVAIGSVYQRSPPGQVKCPNPMTRARWGCPPCSHDHCFDQHPSVPVIYALDLRNGLLIGQAFGLEL